MKNPNDQIKFLNKCHRILKQKHLYNAEHIILNL